MPSSCEAFPRPFRQLPRFQGHNSPTHSCPKQFPQKGMPHRQSNILFICKFIWIFMHKLTAQSSHLPQVCLFRGRPQPRYLLSIKPTGEDRSLVPLGEELVKAVPLNMLPATGTTTAPPTLSLNSLPDCVFHTLHEFSHIRHCIFAVFFYQLHDSGSYDNTI